MSTKIAVTSEDKKSMRGHAGQCKNYTIYTVNDDGQYEKEFVELAPNETLKFTFHADKSENPTNYLFGMDLLLTTHIGLNGVNNLARNGVKALLVKEAASTDEVIEKLINGTLEIYEAMPHNHDHNHNH
jgi:predicted Fe-Mo cluster-binding NifX family protein